MGPPRDDTDEGFPPLKEFDPRLGGGGGPPLLPRGGGGPARVGGGGAFVDLLPPRLGRGNCGGPCRPKFVGGLGPFVEGGEENLLTARGRSSIVGCRGQGSIAGCRGRGSIHISVYAWNVLRNHSHTHARTRTHTRTHIHTHTHLNQLTKRVD